MFNLMIVHTYQHLYVQTKRELIRVPSPTTSKAVPSSPVASVPKVPTPNTPVPISRTTVSSRVRWQPAKRTGPNTVMYKQKLFRRKGIPKTAEVLSWGTVPVKDPVSSTVAESERPGYPFKLDFIFVGFTSLARIGTMTVKMKAMGVKDKKMQWRAQVLM